VRAWGRFAAPRIPSATLPRPSLLTRLDGGADAALTLVSAGPGSGKSALLADWVGTLPSARWLTCEVEHGDADVFWSDLARAIDDTEFEILDVAEPRSRVASLVDALGASETPTAIVVDDFHNAHPDPDDVMNLVAALPPNVRLVLSTRVDPPMPLGRLRIQGRLLELRQADLRFTFDEAGALLAGFGVDIGVDELARLVELTEGWTAGVQLAGLSLRANQRPVELLKSLADSDRSLVDFLMNEVIDLQPADMRGFLMTSAELERFDADLCDAVRPDNDSLAMLERVRAANLFLVQVDPDEGWFRYHHLFGRFLQARLRATEPHRVPEVHRAAAVACAERSLPMDAIRHYARVPDVEAARALLLTQVRDSLSLEERELGRQVSRAWIREFGAGAFETAPQAALECTFVLASTTTTTEPEQWLRLVDGRDESLEPEARLLLHGVWAFHLLRRGDVEAALEHARQAQAIADEGAVNTRWAAALPITAVQTSLLLDDLGGASRQLDLLWRGSRDDPTLAEIRAPGLASLVAVIEGDLREAERFARESLAGADRRGLSPRNYGRAAPHLALGTVALERRDLETADVSLEAALRVAEEGARPPIELLTHLTFVRLRAAQGDDEAAGESVARARAVMPVPASSVVALVDRTEARLLLDCGDLDLASALIQSLPASPAAALLEARLLLLVGDRAAASRVLEGVETPSRRLRIERSLLAARAASDAGTAEQILRDALTFAEPMGFEQTIVSEGPDIMRLLSQLAFEGRMADYVARLNGGSMPSVVHQSSPPQGLVDPLSDRELTVLRRLAGPQDAREIADSLYLSVNTVRSHVKAIYRKLGVGSRADAVSTAKTLGLL
jgi:LuxR family maltose regulon positive regulatory protein